MMRTLFLTLALAGTWQAHAQTASLPQPSAAQVDQAAEQILKATGVPSASVAIVQNGKITYLKAYGDAQLAADGKPAVPATPEMQYSVGSISKQFTASAIMLLVQEGKVSLEDPIAKYLPDLTRAQEVTIRMVLSHTSGYQDYWPEDYVMTSMLQPATAQHILDVWGRKPLDFEPGTKWQYSNSNYVIAGRIVEQVSGNNLVHFLQTHIFTPLGMTNVLNTDAARLPPGDPLGYQRFALGPLRPSPKEGKGWMFAAGELAMTPRDLALWNISIMNQSLLQASSYAELFKPVMLKDGTSSGYGLGFFIRNDHGVAVYEHSGEVSGFVSENMVFPAQKAAITVVTNEMAAPAAGQIARRIAPIVLGAAQHTTRRNPCAECPHRPAGRPHRSQPAHRLLQRLLRRTGHRGFRQQPRATRTTNQHSADDRRTPRRHDLPRIPRPVPRPRAQRHGRHHHHLRNARRQTGTIPGHPRRLSRVASVTSSRLPHRRRASCGAVGYSRDCANRSAKDAFTAQKKHPFFSLPRLTTSTVASATTAAVAASAYR